MTKKKTPTEYTSIKVTAEVYAEIGALRELLVAKGLNTLPPDLRPKLEMGKFGRGETIGVALRALRKTMSR